MKLKYFHPLIYLFMFCWRSCAKPLQSAALLLFLAQYSFQTVCCVTTKLFTLRWNIHLQSLLNEKPEAADGKLSNKRHSEHQTLKVKVRGAHATFSLIFLSFSHTEMSANPCGDKTCFHKVFFVFIIDTEWMCVTFEMFEWGACRMKTWFHSETGQITRLDIGWKGTSGRFPLGLDGYIVH